MDQIPKDYLTDEQWKKIKPIITKSLDNRGVANAHDNRIFIDACLFIIHTNTPWRKLPSQYGKFTGINRRFNRWRRQNIWDHILAVLLNEPDYEWLVFEPSTDESQVPIFTMKWLMMITPSQPLIDQVQTRITEKLSHLQ